MLKLTRFITLLSRENRIRIGLVSITLLLGSTSTWLITKQQNQPLSFQKIRLADAHFRFVAPLLGFEIGDKKQFTELKHLEKQLTSAVEDAIKNGDILSAGVYFRSLSNGKWTGVHEDEKFSPGSLQKVAVMMAYFKLAETEPAVLSQTYLYTGGG